MGRSMNLASRRYNIALGLLRNKRRDFVFSYVVHAKSHTSVSLGRRSNIRDNKRHIHTASSTLHGCETFTSRSTRIPLSSFNCTWSFPGSSEPSGDHPRSVGLGVETWTLYSGTEGEESAVTAPARVDELYLEGHNRALRLLVDPD